MTVIMTVIMGMILAAMFAMLMIVMVTMIMRASMQGFRCVSAAFRFERRFDHCHSCAE